MLARSLALAVALLLTALPAVAAPTSGEEAATGR